MTCLNEVASLDSNHDLVSSNKTVEDNGIVKRLGNVIRRIRDDLVVDLDEWVRTGGEDEEYYPTGGCCCV